MSKERELLKETLSFLVLDWGRGEKLYKQIEAIFTQPEQEPVAWMYEYADRSSFDASFTGNWKERISRTKPDGTAKWYPTNFESTIRNLVPLYSPPKREHIETEQEGVYQKLLRLEGGVGTEILPSELWLDGYETGKRTLPTNQQPAVPTPKPVPPPNEFIKEHTIPRQQRKEIKVPCGSTEYMFGFKDGVLYAEKERGIGVNNEKI